MGSRKERAIALRVLGFVAAERRHVLLPACLPARLPGRLQGSVVIRQRVKRQKETADGRLVERERLEACVLHCDIIRDDFWRQHPELLA